MPPAAPRSPSLALCTLPGPPVCVTAPLNPRPNPPYCHLSPALTPPLPSQQCSPPPQRQVPGFSAAPSPTPAGDQGRASATLCCVFPPAGDVCPSSRWGAQSACMRKPRNTRKGVHPMPGMCHMNPKEAQLHFPKYFLRHLNHDMSASSRLPYSYKPMRCLLHPEYPSPSGTAGVHCVPLKTC